MLSANWVSTASNVPVEIQEPDGTLLTQGDFDGVTVGLLSDLSTSTQEVVGITNPDAGNWTIIIPDATGLGDVTFNALAGGATCSQYHRYHFPGGGRAGRQCVNRILDRRGLGRI